MKRPTTQEDLDEFSRRLYASAEDIYRITPYTKKGCHQLINSILAEMEAEGTPRIATRPQMVPTWRVLEKLGINTRTK